MAPADDAGVYLNFTSDEGEERVRIGVRTGQVRAARGAEDDYDPDNLFHLNQNIAPSTRDGG